MSLYDVAIFENLEAAGKFKIIHNIFPRQQDISYSILNTYKAEGPAKGIQKPVDLPRGLLCSISVYKKFCETEVPSIFFFF